MLPCSMSARVKGPLEQVEAATQTAEEARQQDKPRPGWRGYHPDPGISQSAASRWVRNMARGVWRFLKALPALDPERFEGLPATLAA